jgi:hypothetical protein
VPRADYVRHFTTEPVVLNVDSPQQHFYNARARAGELFIVAGPDALPKSALHEGLPLEQWAAARNAVIADWAAHYGQEAADALPYAHWAVQFPFDPEVAELAGDLRKRAEEAAAAKAAEKPAPVAAEVDPRERSRKALAAARAAATEAAKAKADAAAAKTKADADEAEKAKAAKAKGKAPPPAPQTTPTTGSER